MADLFEMTFTIDQEFNMTFDDLLIFMINPPVTKADYYMVKSDLFRTVIEQGYFKNVIKLDCFVTNLAIEIGN